MGVFLFFYLTLTSKLTLIRGIATGSSRLSNRTKILWTSSPFFSKATTAPIEPFTRPFLGSIFRLNALYILIRCSYSYLNITLVPIATSSNGGSAPAF